MRKKEIVIVVNYLTNGGAERVLSELIKDWNAKKYHIIILQLKADIFIESFLNSKDVSIVNIKSISNNKIVKYLQYISSLVRILKENRNAVVLAFVNQAIYTISVTSLFVHNRIIFSERCDPQNSPPGKFRRMIRNLAYYTADVCVFQTEDAKRYFPAKIQKKSIIIPNPVNPDLPERFQGERKKTVIAACRLNQQKNVPMMIEAFAKVNEDYPDYTLEIYGRGEEEDILRRQIARLGLQEKILLMGFSQDIYERMHDCAMYVSSSNYEGISNSMLEAMALGLPCICTDCPAGGARLVIQDSENGLLVPVGDVDAMYQAMKRIIEEPDFARRLSDNAYKIRERFSIEKISRQWLDLM